MIDNGLSVQAAVGGGSSRRDRVPPDLTIPAPPGEPRIGLAPVGRAAELAWLDGWWERARAGRAGRVLLTGPSGIGKSSLLREFGDAAGTGGTVAWLDGEPGAAAGSTLARFAASFGVGVGDGRDVVADLLGALGERQDDGPVLLAWEDLHWVDAESATVLARVLRRLREDRVLTVATARDEALTAPWPTLFAESADAGTRTVGGLDAPAVAELARTLRPAPWRARALRHLHTQTAGHPLYLVTLLRELSDEVLAGRDPFPAPRSLAAEIGDIVDRVSEPARVTLAVLAVLDRPVDRAMLDRVADLPPGRAGDALLELARTGLVEIRSGAPRPVVRIHHPLQASGVRDALDADERARLHLAAARELGGRDGLPHRVAAADGRPDPGLAAELESVAAAEPVDHGEAATWLLAAAGVAPDGAEAERLRLAAGLRLVEAYDAERLAALAPTVRAAGPCAARSVVLGFLADHEDAPESVVYQQEALDDGSAPPEVRALAGLRLALEHTVRGHGAAARRAATAAAALTSQPLRREEALMHEAFGIALEQEPALGLSHLDGAVDSALGADLAITAGTLHLAAGEFAAARTRLGEGLNRARHGGASTTTHRGHVHLAEALFHCGRWDQAQAHAGIALTWFVDGDLCWAAASAHAAAALVPAARGDEATARRHLDDARAAVAFAPNRQGRLAVAIAEAVLARSIDPPRMLDAVGALPQIAAERGYDSAPWAPWRMLHVEALVEAGRVDAARTAARAASTDREPPLWFALTRHRLEGRIAEIDGDRPAAAVWFRAGLALAGPEVTGVEDCQVEIAELHLALGRLPAGRTDGVASRRSLETARTMFVALGATAWTARVDAIAQPSGPGPGGLALTPRERQVTSCIVRGLTRREAAEELWVTPKAVDYHLRNAYAKLGISSRRELRGLSASGTTVGGPG